MSHAWLLCICGLVHLSAAALDKDVPRQTSASYRKALASDSTAPPFVQVTLIDKVNGTIRHTCVTANSLVRAIGIENGFESGGESWTQAKKIALANSERVFRFSNPQALDAVPTTFSDADLHDMRTQLSAYSNDELLQGFSYHPLGPLHALYRWKKSYRDAAACFLIERGMAPAIGDRSALLIANVEI